MSKRKSQSKTTDEEATPHPEFLIKSIAAQGYSLETSLADLIDNSISANADKVEILINPDNQPFTLFLADNGDGMDEKALIGKMQFPSNSPDSIRSADDLGRFGMGLKTASFAQTRRFTVISRKKGQAKYNARTWDVLYLKKVKKWKILINTKKEIDDLLSKYQELNNAFLNNFDKYAPNTIVVWQGLYKFEEYMDSDNKSQALKKEITEVTSEHLSLVFHRFLTDKKRLLNIRINNNIIQPFNPFPEDQQDLRKIDVNQKRFQSGKLKIEGYILPSRSLIESKETSIWTLPNKSLMDMEGIYIYRANRIIRYGEWNNIIKKVPRLQLARLKVDIENNVDHFFHLNVAKSSITIPYELKAAFLRYISVLRTEAEKEYYNRGIKSIPTKKSEAIDSLFIKVPSNKGMLLELNSAFPLLNNLLNQLNASQVSLLNVLIRIINTAINKIRQVHEDINYHSFVDDTDSLGEDALISAIKALKSTGLSSQQIKDGVILSLGFKLESLSVEVSKLLN